MLNLVNQICVGKHPGKTHPNIRVDCVVDDTNVWTCLDIFGRLHSLPSTFHHTTVHNKKKFNMEHGTGLFLNPLNHEKNAFAHDHVNKFLGRINCRLCTAFFLYANWQDEKFVQTPCNHAASTMQWKRCGADCAFRERTKTAVSTLQRQNFGC